MGTVPAQLDLALVLSIRRGCHGASGVAGVAVLVCFLLVRRRAYDAGLRYEKYTHVHHRFFGSLEKSGAVSYSL